MRVPVPADERNMSEPQIRGWCPTVFEPMPAADGLLVNVKPPVRGWTAAELRRIAAAAALHGSGRLLVTNRGNLQVRGLSPAGARAFAAVMLESGLVSPGRDVERRRNILMLATQTDESEAFASRLESWLETDAGLAGLPAKFCFAVTSAACARDCTIADLCIQVCGTKAWVVVAGDAVDVGAFGVLTHEPLATVASITQAFLDLAPRTAMRPRRLKDLIAQVGIDAVLTAAGLRAGDGPELAEPASYVGSLGGGRFGLSVPFGRVGAAMLIQVAKLAEQFGDGRLTLGAHRTFVLFGTRSETRAPHDSNREPELSEQASRSGFIVDARDPRLRVAACMGGSGCDRAVIDVQAVAESLAPWWGGNGVLHVSGCPKGCAHPGRAAVTLVASAPHGRFYVSRGSRADAPTSNTIGLDEVRDLLTAVGSRSLS